MKRVIAILLALAMVFALCACGAKEEAPAAQSGEAAAPAAEASTEVVKLKLGHPLAPTTSQHIYLEKWAELVKEASGGKYEITVYPSAQFGEAKELVESLSMGVYDLAWCDCAVMDFLVPDMNLVNLPFFFTTYDQLWNAVDGEVGTVLAEAIEAKGNIHPLSYFNLGCRQIFSNREEITSLESIKNLKFRVPELDLWIKTFETLGMNSTPVAWSELYNALATKVVDGGCANWETIALQGMHNEAPYLLHSNHFFQMGVPAFNLDFWNSLSAEDQAMFTETCAQAAAEQRQDVEDKDAGYIEQILADGATITPIADFADYDEVVERYKTGLWAEMVEQADAAELYAAMCEACGR